MTLQQEFTIEDIAGIEARREYVTTFWDFVVGILIASIGFAVGMTVNNADSFGMAFFLALVLGILALVPFFVIKKQWFLKLLFTGFSSGALILTCSYGFSRSNNVALLLVLPAFISGIILLFNIFLYAIRPNLVLIVKTKSSSDAIDIQRKKTGLLNLIFGGKEEEHTGYTEVLPVENAEASIRELGAVISDIQKFGDFGIEKWQEPCFKTDTVQKQ